MSALDLLLSRKALAAGVGLTTRRNRVLPTADANIAIGPRSGVGRPLRDTPEPSVGSRTFVFSVFGSTVGTIANRFGAGLKVVMRNLACGVVTYAVGALRTDDQGFWSDVIRINDLGVKINGKDPAPVVATVPSYGVTATPYVASYTASCVGDAARSTIFIGRNYAVASVSKTGTTRSTLNAALVYQYSPTFSAGVRSDKNGKFSFYGARILPDDANTMQYFDTNTSVITATETTPYLTLTTSNTGRVDLLSDYGQFAAGVTTRIPASEPTNVWASWTYVVNTVPTSDVIAAYAYGGSDLVVSATATLSGESSHIHTYTPPGDGTQYILRDTYMVECTTFVKLTNALTGDLFRMSIVSSTDLFRSWGEIVDFSGEGLTTYSSASKDLIYADFDNDVTLVLEASISGAEDYVQSTWSQSTARSITCLLKLDYVLTVKGSRIEFSFFEGDVCAVIPDGRPKFNPMPGIILAIRDAPMKTAAIVAPMFMGQGVCPFIAYTTKEEDAAGATPEIYLDMNIVPEDMYIGTGQVILDGVVHFIPSNLTMMVQRYLQGIAPSIRLTSTASGWIRNSTLGAMVFPTVTPFRLQYANGVKGEWQSALGAEFVGNPAVTISRI